MKKILLFTTLFFSSILNAEELEEGKVYRLHKTVYDVELARDTSKKFIAVKESKFRVVDSSNTSHYVVSFVTLYNHIPETGFLLKSTVRTDEEYLLKKKINEVPLEKSSSISRGGAVSGPLIVPFKYRTSDKILSGDATIGYYAGYSIEPKIPFTETRVPISPFIAGGLSQVSVAENEDIINQTGITLAVGVLIQNWAGINIGLVYGQDRIGDKNWEYEGKGWISFMVGWEL